MGVEGFEDDEEGDDEEGDNEDARPRPGLSKPKRARNSSGGRWMAVGLETMGMESALGMRPVVASSEGSRTSGVGPVARGVRRGGSWKD